MIGSSKTCGTTPTPAKQTPATANTSQAWANFWTKGTDAFGNEIVVAVIDSGFDLTHEDLADSFFVNKNEIPYNGIDDDNNGYVDDVTGWNVSRQSWKISSKNTHGTVVSGVVGAKGHNGTGIVGVNWNTKILPIQISLGRKTDVAPTLTSTLFKAYSYIIEMKNLWLLTGGKRGANIVATNSSFGINGANCQSGSYPIWNELFHRMGQLGILSVVAAPNTPYNVDVVGDVPSGCSSKYIISVTNIRKNRGFHPFSSSWGKKTIDLAAPGTDIVTTYPGHQYVLTTGTSLSSPHVAGAVAYLHSVASQRLAQNYLYNPFSTALVFKKILLKSAAKINANRSWSRAISNGLVSGGTLDVYRAAQMANSY